MEAKQVVGCDIESSNILGDIIEQQREFQRRQEARQSQKPVSGSSNSNLSQPEDQQQPVNVGRCGQAKTRRKFSLSLAMSNLANFTSGTSAGGSASGLQAGQLGSTPTRPPRHLQHRASLVPGELSDFRARPSESEVGVERSPGEKKRGFMHKAIRRGSKMFDSMLLSSAQQQAADAAALAVAAAATCGQANPDSSPGSSGADHEAELEVDQFEPRPNFAQAGAAEQEAEKPRRARRLRLGSIPHDLRRALSLSSNAHFQRKSSKQHEPADIGSVLGQNFNSGTSPNLTNGNNSNSNSSGASSKGAKSKPGQATGVTFSRLRRKNSLFSPLTAGSAFYHAHSNSAIGVQQSQFDKCSPSALSGHQTNQSASFTLQQDHNQTYKLIIFGSSAVGKTSLIQRFLYGHFPVTHKPTVEELHSNKYNIPELGEIYLEILDTSGTFEFPAMRRLSIEKGDAFILVYSVADSASWQEVIHLRNTILEEKHDQQHSQSAAPAAGQQHQQQRPSGRVVPPRPAPLGRYPLGGSDQDKPSISSIYAAATRLTSSELRSASMRHAQAPDRRLSVSHPPPSVGATPTKTAFNPQVAQGLSQTAATITANEELNQRSTIAHYNSQLSKLLQQAPSSGSPNKGRLLQWQSIEKEKEKETERAANESFERAGAGAGPARESGSSSDRSSCDVNLEGSSVSASSGRPAGLESTPASSRREILVKGQARTPIVVVANKCDLDTSAHQVDQNEAERLVRDMWGNSFVKCSAKEALNIDRVFKELLRQAKVPEVLANHVEKVHQQRRQSLPVLSAHHVRGLRNSQQQSQQASFATSGSHSSQQQEPNSTRPTSSASEDSQCTVM